VTMVYRFESNSQIKTNNCLCYLLHCDFIFIYFDIILLYTVKQQECEVLAVQTTSITEHRATIFNIENWDGDFSIGK